MLGQLTFSSMNNHKILSSDWPTYPFVLLLRSPIVEIKVEGRPETWSNIQVDV